MPGPILSGTGPALEARHSGVRVAMKCARLFAREEDAWDFAERDPSRSDHFHSEMREIRMGYRVRLGEQAPSAKPFP